MKFVSISKTLLKIAFIPFIIAFNSFLYYQAYISLTEGFDWVYHKEPSLKVPIINAIAARLNPLQVNVYEIADLKNLLEDYQSSEGKSTNGTENVNLTALDLNFLQLAKEYSDFIQLSKEIKGFKIDLTNSSSGHRLDQKQYTKEKNDILSWDQQKEQLTSKKQELLAFRAELETKRSDIQKTATEPQSTKQLDEKPRKVISQAECKKIQSEIKIVKEKKEKLVSQNESIEQQILSLESSKVDLTPEEQRLRLLLQMRGVNLTVLNNDLRSVLKLEEWLKKFEDGLSSFKKNVDNNFQYVRERYASLNDSDPEELKREGSKEFATLQVLENGKKLLKFQVKKLVKYSFETAAIRKILLSELAQKSSFTILSEKIKHEMNEIAQNTPKLESLLKNVEDLNAKLTELSQKIIPKKEIEQIDEEENTLQKELQSKCGDDATQITEEPRQNHQDEIEEKEAALAHVASIERQIEDCDQSILTIDMQLVVLRNQIIDGQGFLASLGQNITKRFNEVELNYVKKLQLAKAAQNRLSLIKNESKIILQNV